LPTGDLPEPVARELAEAQVVRAADALVASTEHEWHELASLYGARNDGLRTIHPGVDHELFSPGDREAARARLGLDPQGPVVLSVGRIQPLKGLSLAVEALARLRSLRHPPILLVVGGPSGPRGDEELVDLKKLARSLGVAEQMRWLGPRPHEGLPDIYRAADAVVVCSYSESFGFAALEAHACGVPVLGTAVGGLSYIVRDGRSGFLFDRRDPDVFAERLGAVLSNYDLRAQLGDAARRAAQRFSWHASARSLLRLYDSLVEQPMMETCVL
ncbi:MAG TPA: glycosyltransferase, partial [Actinomycetota bacterium]|nr:glycosyltransferase [Actinomycetota bacterium]